MEEAGNKENKKECNGGGALSIRPQVLFESNAFF